MINEPSKILVEMRSANTCYETRSCALASSPPALTYARLAFFRSIPRYTASGVLLPQGIVGHAKHASKRGSSLALKNVGLKARAGFLA